MGLQSYITDSKNSKKTNVVTHNDKNSSNALVVASHPLKTYENSIVFFTNSTYGTNMNIAPSVGLSPEIIYQENTEWSTSAISGSWNFSNNDISPYAGTACIDATATINGSVAQFSKGDYIVLENYISITGYIYFTSWNDSGTDKGVSIYGWDTINGNIVGSLVDITDYVSPSNLNVWHKFTIPLLDMSLYGQSINSIRISTVDIGPGLPPDYYLDNLQIEQSLTSTIISSEFSIEPSLETWIYVENINLFIADNDYDSTLADSTIPKIPYDSLLGVASLSSGIVYRRIQDGTVEFSYNIKQLSDILSIPTASLSSYGSAGTTNTWLLINITLTEPIILKAENEDKLSIEINDDLSGLDILSISAGCKVEKRT